MVSTVSYEDAKARRVDRQTEGGKIRMNRFFISSPDNRDLPFANLTEQEPGRSSRVHFHTADEFVVIVDGKAKLGRKELAPYSVHFVRAYTPYGPFLADDDVGLTFFLLRAHYDAKALYLPENRTMLQQIPNRQPWQISCPVAWPAAKDADNVLLQEISGMTDENGLAAYTLSMKANAKTQAPDPAQGDGQYLAVLKGSLFHEGKELQAPVLVFAYPNDGPYQILAGSTGMEALVLNFPRVQKNSARSNTETQKTAGFKTWQCSLCAFAYNEETGLPNDGIAPRTQWSDVPEAWTCPDCSASKSDFHLSES